VSGARAEAVGVAVPAERPAARAWRLPRNRSVWIGAAGLALIVTIAVLAPYLDTTNPAAIDPVARNKRPGAERVITEMVPVQSMAATSVLPAPAVPVTRIR